MPENPVDLLPTEWESERQKPKEPFFGPGLPIVFVVLVSVVFATMAYGQGVFAQIGAATLGAIAAGVINAIYR